MARNSLTLRRGRAYYSAPAAERLTVHAPLSDMTACSVAPSLPDGPRLSASATTFQWLARPYAFLDECAAEFGDTFALTFTHFGTHVVVAHPDDVRDIFTADVSQLCAGRGNALLEPILGKHSLLLVDGDRHVAHRALLQPAFRGDRLH